MQDASRLQRTSSPATGLASLASQHLQYGPHMSRETKGQPRAGEPPRGGGLCFSRASDAGIHADVDDSNAERIDGVADRAWAIGILR